MKRRTKIIIPISFNLRMNSETFESLKKKFEIPDRVKLMMDQDGLIKVVAESDHSTAEIYLKGAHVTSFQQKGEKLLLFMSPSAKMPRGNMLHGGIPLCFPWFGNRDGEKLSHGFARNSIWDLVETKGKSDGAVELTFQLPSDVLREAGWAPVEVLYRVTVEKKLQLELIVNNTTSLPFSYEECFHSYFLVGDINQVTVHGLKGLTYLDKNEDFAAKQELRDELPIVGETNSVYLHSTAPIEIHDHSLQRTIRIEKEHSRSTVVWNPWSKKAKEIADFGPDDYQHMLCVESGNVKEYALTVPPGETSTMKVQLSYVKDSD
ncbi:MAG: D-hexose-6-phosphate mutarotase [Verrucomicrobiae bacterium]|nr:D-hexose-6-phosphate mutarotase [Verrucomicrobiae bacterium]